MNKAVKNFICVFFAVAIAFASAAIPYGGVSLRAEAVENSVTANVAADSDPYHIMRPAQTPALSFRALTKRLNFLPARLSLVNSTSNILKQTIR